MSGGGQGAGVTRREAASRRHHVRARDVHQQKLGHAIFRSAQHLPPARPAPPRV